MYSNSPLNAIDTNTNMGGFSKVRKTKKKRLGSGPTRKKSSKSYKKRSKPYVKKKESTKKKHECSCSCSSSCKKKH